MSVATDSLGAAIAAPAFARAGEIGSGVSFRDVTVTYGATTVLEGLNLEVEPGEILALIGPSGSGKTTALRVVAGFIKPSRGRVSIGDEDVTACRPMPVALAWWCRITRSFRICGSTRMSPSASGHKMRQES
jgi:2-aminoethylphosphonate transport system ATP-binding protein